jgi:hypothetical protein
MSSALLLFTALTLTACTDSSPVAPDAARLEAAGSASLERSSESSEGTEHVTKPVSFTMEGGHCGLTTTVTGNGVLQRVTRSYQSRNGVWHVSFQEVATGTAIGADGSRYTFYYAISATSVNPTGPNDLRVIDIVDFFSLNGRGSAPNVTVFIKGRFTYPDFVAIGTPVVLGAGIACDPI